jgi:hypothetical protein
MTNEAFEVLREMYSTCVTHPEKYSGDFYEFYKDFINETSRRSDNTGGIGNENSN